MQRPRCATPCATSGLAPDVVLVSPARRTQETLAALEPWDDTPLVEPLEALYLANLPQLLTSCTT